MSTCGKGGGGVRVENVGGIYSAGKYHVLAICVRTQNDFNITGCIVTPPNNKTRLNRFIFVYNGRYTRKQDGTRLKCIFMQEYKLKVYIYALKSAKSATFPLTPHSNTLFLTPLRFA